MSATGTAVQAARSRGAAPRIGWLLSVILVCAAFFVSCERRAPRAVETAPRALPREVLALVSVAPLPGVVKRVGGIGRALGAWREKPEEAWAVLRLLLEDAVDPLAVVRWDRPLHAALAAGPGGRMHWVFGLPAARPQRALERLVQRCGGARDGRHPAPGAAAGWVRLQGTGRGVLPCKYHVRAVPGGLVLALGGVPKGSVFDLLRHRLGGRAPAAVGDGDLLRIRLSVPMLLARAGLTDQKVSESIALAGMGAALLGVDASAGPKLVAWLKGLWQKVRSASEVRLRLGASSRAIRWSLELVGQPRGALADWARKFHPAPFGLSDPDASPAVAVLRLAGRQAGAPAAGARRAAARRAAARPGASPSGGPTGKRGTAAGSVDQAKPSGAAQALLSLAIAKLVPQPLRGAARLLARELLLGPGELRVHLGWGSRPGTYALGISVRRPGAEQAARSVLGAAEMVLGHLLSTSAASGAGAGRTQGRALVSFDRGSGAGGGWVRLPLPQAARRGPARWLRALADGDRLELATAGERGRLALWLGPGARKAAAQAVRASGRPRPGGGQDVRVAGELLVFAARLLGSGTSGGDRSAEPAARDGATVRLAWGSRPESGSLFFEMRLPVSAVRALGDALGRLTASGTGDGETPAGWDAWLSRSGDSDDEDAL